MPNKPPVFRPAHIPSPEQRRRAYDRERGSAHARGYGSKWEKARGAFLAEHPLCRACKEHGALELAVIVDHTSNRTAATQVCSGLNPTGNRSVSHATTGRLG